VVPDLIRIATRESALAMCQTEMIAARLRELYPGLGVELVGMTTKGDQILDRPLAQVGGKGLFVKELENALAGNRADLAVHSLKDVPMVMPPGFALAFVAGREDPHDAFVSVRYAKLSDLPPGARVGTSRNSTAANTTPSSSPPRDCAGSAWASASARPCRWRLPCPR
jgi:hydroxymethylbilane synthase